MATIRSLLALGNAKLGRAIHHFDLAAVHTCPGRSKVCEAACYATRGRFHTSLVRDRLRWCLAQSKRPDFADRMVREVRGKGALVVRVHVSGDFYDPEYAGKWLSVFRRCPTATFYFYTRSWRVAEVVPVLEQATALDNVRAWYSADVETGLPDPLPERVRVAWLQTDPDEPVAGNLVFRDEPVRGTRPRTALPVVCPNETPAGHRFGVNCGNCGHCWKA
ncbi:hypothetical protein VT84_06490 [Gemmata sp. SH-PL17]|uniref:GP88 family protein n=1 Tax=Gemmata sp. SH-PL17 TaxID=1630693 RepID=UPI00078CE452|nr:hypothetical protein [Gemmata sp. SH-PL17]AMV24025.1 hypothetical protein VT84_06490 [Gemmata sp. SH-PL17]